MNSLKSRKKTACFAFGVLALWITATTEIRAQGPAVDPEAVRLLRGMTDYMSSLTQFSVKAQNVFEDVLDSGHRVDYDLSASVIVSRPNKLRVDRRAGPIEQIYFYDGTALTQYRPLERVYATEAAPGTIEGLFDFARESLGLSMPISDLVYRDAFPLLMKDVTLAMVVGKVDIGGVTCHHLLFSRPGVDFQVWVADAGPPLPRKYVVTDTGTPELLSITTVMSDWNVAPAVNDTRFTFAPPQGSTAIAFLKIETASGPIRK
jgi:hypothetical protein